MVSYCLGNPNKEPFHVLLHIIAVIVFVYIAPLWQKRYISFRQVKTALLNRNSLRQE